MFFALKNQKEDTAYAGNANVMEQSQNLQGKQKNTARMNTVQAEETIEHEGEHYGGVDEKVRAAFVKA